jgi:dimethylargininase
MFSKAIVRPPAANFAQGLTKAGLGRPDVEQALVQHARYCAALERCGLSLTRLEPEARHPDSTFVEDVAVLTERCAILTRPGAPSRQGEVDGIREPLRRFYSKFQTIRAPGTLDGGDICEAGTHFFIGVSERTNAEGARQLAELLAQEGYTSSTVDIHGAPGILHLKSGIAYLGDNRLALIDALAGRAEFRGYEIVHVPPAENYAANCVRVNDTVLLAAGFPAFEALVRGLGYRVLALEVSEYQKMDGGLSCLSLRF